MEFVVSVMLVAYFRHVFAAVVEVELVADVESPVFAQPVSTDRESKAEIVSRVFMFSSVDLK